MAPKKTNSKLTVQLFYDSLRAKVSIQNATLILESALIPMGMSASQGESELTQEQAKDLCMYMINKGGPAFNVGQSIYRSYLQ